MDVIAVQALIDLTDYIESRFPNSVDMTRAESAAKFVAEWKPAFAPTGETYTEFCPHRAPDGEFVGNYGSPEEVIAAAKQQFDAYAADKTGTLYWRIKPEVDCFRAGKNAGCWMFYMRLLISNKPRKS